MLKMQKQDFKKAVASIETLHGNMAVLSRLSPMLKDPNSDIENVARLVSSDSALAASIIRISNSAFYASGAKVGDVPSALGKVGFNEALRLVGMALSKQVFMRDLEVYGVTADVYWSESYFTGLFLEAIGRQLGLDPNDAYMVGLLHAIGKVVLNELVDPEQVEVYWDPTLKAEEWEEVMFGVHYDEAGSVLLEAWKFPEEIYKRVGDQLDISAQRKDRILGSLAFTRELIAFNDYDFDRETWELPESHDFYVSCRISESILASEIIRCREDLADVRRTIQGN